MVRPTDTQHHRAPRPYPARRTALAASLVLAVGIAPSHAVHARQDQPATPPAANLLRNPGEGIAPPLDAAAQALVDAPYLTEAERQALRLKHGVPTPADFESTPILAKFALARGAWNDASLEATMTDAEDRAEALLHRGSPRNALDTLADRATPRARTLRLMAHHTLGDRDGAQAAVAALAQTDLSADATSAEDVLWVVRGLSLATRLGLGPDAGAGNAADPEAAIAEARTAGSRSLMGMLFAARERLDKLDPSVPLAEAELLWEKDNPSEAGEAMETALSLNPSNAAAWITLGEMAVSRFDFARAESIVRHLESLAASMPEPAAFGLAPEAELLRARLRLKQLDPVAAREAADRVLEAFPEQRTALALRAAAQAGAFAFEDADATLARFAELSPGSAEALMEVGRMLSDRRQYADAERYLARAVALEPAWAEPAIELGLMLVQAGKDDAARDILARAAALDPFNVRTANSLKLVRELQNYATFTSDHFVVRYRPGVDEVLASEMLPVLERIFARVTGDGVGGMAHVPPGRTTIELMPDHQWFSVRITGMPQVHTIAAATGPVIAMEAPRSGPGHKVGPYDWPRVIQHEYTHTVSLSRARNRLPHWFTEAAAVYLEDGPRDYPTATLLARALESGTLFDFDQINIAFVRPEKPTDRQQAYAQGHWMYEFMIERFGKDTPLAMLDRYAEGMDEAGALRAVLNLSRDEFLAQFKEWARAQVIAWGLALPEGTPTLGQLLAAEAAAGGGGGGPAAAITEPTREMADRWLTSHPTHPEVLALAVALTLRDHNGTPTPEMIPLLNRAAAARPVDPQPRRLLARMALSAQPTGAPPAEAVEHLEWLDAREQYSTVYAVGLARAYAAAGDWTRAAAKAERATQISPYDASLRELAASIALKRNALDDAERHLRALTRLEPDREVHQRRLDAFRAKHPATK